MPFALVMTALRSYAHRAVTSSPKPQDRWTSHTQRVSQQQQPQLECGRRAGAGWVLEICSGAAAVQRQLNRLTGPRSRRRLGQRRCGRSVALRPGYLPVGASSLTAVRLRAG